MADMANAATLAHLARVSRATHRLFTARALVRKVLERSADATIRLPVRLGTLQFPMRLAPRDYVDFNLYYYGYFEKEEGRLLCALLQPGGVMFDVGANIGYYSIGAALCVGPAGQVHAFEPTPAVHRRLLENVALNGLRQVVVHELAVADTAGSATMYDLPGNSGGNSLGRHAASRVSYPVWTIRLDDYVREHAVPRVDLVKLDIEGAEVLALRGMEATLRRFRPHLLLEINPKCLQRLGFTAAQVVATLHTYGYTLVDVKTRRPFAASAESTHACDVHAIPAGA